MGTEIYRNSNYKVMAVPTMKDSHQDLGFYEIHNIKYGIIEVTTSVMYEALALADDFDTKLRDRQATTSKVTALTSH